MGLFLWSVKLLNVLPLFKIHVSKTYKVIRTCANINTLFKTFILSSTIAIIQGCGPDPEWKVKGFESEASYLKKLHDDAIVKLPEQFNTNEIVAILKGWIVCDLYFTSSGIIRNYAKKQDILPST